MEQEKRVITMRTVFYVVVYGIFGYVLERVINLIAYGAWFDNRVLTLPVQPMYGLGVVLAVVIFRHMKRFPINRGWQVALLFPVAILTTAFSEWISGEGYELLSGRTLWDYGQTFAMCDYPYVCIFPTTLFGILSALTVLFIHPSVERLGARLPAWTVYGITGLVMLDMIITYTLMAF